MVQALGKGSLRAAGSPWAWTLCALMQLGCQDFQAASALADKAVQCLGSVGYEPLDLVRPQGYQEVWGALARACRLAAAWHASQLLGLAGVHCVMPCDGSRMCMQLTICLCSLRMMSWALL